MQFQVTAIEFDFDDALHTNAVVKRWESIPT